MTATINQIKKRKDSSTILKWIEKENLDLEQYTCVELLEEFETCFRGYYTDLKDLVKENLSECDIPPFVTIDMDKTVAEIKKQFKVIEINDKFAVFDF